MGEYIDVELGNLIIWSDNPRIANQRADTEQIAIDLTYDIVGKDKMNALAEDIGQFGLNHNTLPVVVPNEAQQGKYDVYDGNRRIIILKQFTGNTENVQGITPNIQYTSESKIKVYSTNIEEAYRLMDLEHAGEQEGRGQIAWESYQRDIAFARRNIPCQYQTAYEVSRICRLSRKSDYKVIPYTDLDTLFNSVIIKSLFNIIEWDFTNEEFIRNTYFKLKTNKPSRIPYSRYLPRLATNEGELEKFRRKLFNEPDEPRIVVTLTKTHGFLDEQFSNEWIGISRDGETIPITNANIQYYFNAQNFTDINCIGNWLIKIEVLEQEFEVDYTVNPYNNKILRIKEGPFFKYNSLHYNEFIEHASNSKGENCIDEVVLEFHTEVEYTVDEATKTVKFNETGNVELEASYVDDYTGEISVTKAIPITTRVLHAEPIQNEDFFLRQSIINEPLNFTPLINTIINKLDDLYKANDYVEVVSSSLRCVIELVIEEMAAIHEFSNIRDLKQCLRELYTKFRDGHYKQKLFENYGGTFQQISNIIDQYTDDNINSLASFLHLGAHKNTKYLDVSLLDNKLSLLSLIIELSHTYLKFKASGVI